MITGLPSWRRDIRPPADLDEEIPETFNMTAALLDRHIKAGDGERIAVVTDSQSLTYSQLLALVNRAANGLLSLGVRREERVVILLADGPAFLATFLGAMRIGAVPVPVNTLSGVDDYAYYLEDSGARALIVDAALWERISPVRSRASGLEHVIVAGEAPAGATSLEGLLAAQPAELQPAATHRDAAAYWLYSSGTTGRPKGVVHLHQDMVHCTAAYARHVLAMTADDRTYSASRLFFSYGLVNSLYIPLWTGGSVALSAGRPDPASVLATIQVHRPTIFFAVPSFYAALLRHLNESDNSADLSSLRLAVSAGEALPAALYDRWVERTGVELLDGIGSTEFGYIFISNYPGRVRPGSSGEIVAGQQARVVDADGRDAPDGEIGDLLVKGGSIAAGYWSKREQTRAAFQGEWLRTGDKYHRDADGYYWFHGRADDLMRVNGQWVSPLEIESALLTHPAVTECAVVGAPDDDGLEKPKAYVVSGASVSVADLDQHVRTCLPAYKCPRWFELVSELPKTPTGKIQRYRLR
jgi:benzoate-CoA ligase